MIVGKVKKGESKFTKQWVIDAGPKNNTAGDDFSQLDNVTCLIDYTEKFLVDLGSHNPFEEIALEIVLTPINGLDFTPPVVEKERRPVSFSISIRSNIDGNYRLSTGGIFLEYEHLKDRGIGSYIMIKLLNQIKCNIDVSKIENPSFLLSDAQVREQNDLLLRNGFYRRLGCEIESYDDKGSETQFGKAILSFDQLPASWDNDKVTELSLDDYLVKKLNELKQINLAVDGLKHKVRHLEYELSPWRRVKNYYYQFIGRVKLVVALLLLVAL